MSKAPKEGSSPQPKAEIGAEATATAAPKNFRNHPDIENFFRFIYENDLREEALEIFDGVVAERSAKKLKH